MLKGKRFKTLLGISIPIGGICLILYALYLPLPTEKRPSIFYSTHHREDLRLLTNKVIKRAVESVDVYTYALTDAHVLSDLKKKAKSGVEINISYHGSNCPRLKHLEDPNFHLHPLKERGLMHAKWLIVDKTLLFLGSANLTSSSLAMHDNFMMGLYAPDLARALIHPPSEFQSQIQGQNLLFFLLPGAKPFSHLLHTLKTANKRVVAALFTLTHPELVETLIDLHQRGIQIELFLDQTSARGASREALKKLLNAGICVKQNQGLQLLHHKWAVVDETVFVLGSANWTKAAFEKNKDFLLFLSPLSKHQIKYLKNVIKKIRIDSDNCN